jgi:hypothetical protein
MTREFGIEPADRVRESQDLNVHFQGGEVE